MKVDMKELEKNIRQHWETDFVVTDIRLSWQDARQLGEDELRSDELSAAIFTVGCYTVRIAQKPDGEGKERIARLREMLSQEEPERVNASCALTTKVSAMHSIDPKWAFAGALKHICKVTPANDHFGDRSLSLVCMIKKTKALSDEDACLFVCIDNAGFTFAYNEWYILHPDGLVESFSVKRQSLFTGRLLE